MDALWISVDPAERLDVVDPEHRVLSAVVELGLDADHVVTQIVPGAPSRPVAVLRRIRTDPDAAAPRRVQRVARKLARFLNGAVAVLPASDEAGAPVVVGDAAAGQDCLDAARAARDRLTGRCVRFPGQDRLNGVVTVRRILERSAIARVAGSGWPVELDDRVDTGGFLRPTFELGDLVLRVGPAGDGLLVSTEIAEPHRCCGAH